MKIICIVLKTMNSQKYASLCCFNATVLFLLLPAAPAMSQLVNREKARKEVEKTFGDPAGMVRLDPESRVWVDKKKRRVVVDGYIALDSGQLEMLACPVGTKEHESIVAVFSKAYFVHAGLLAAGASTGQPVKWEPQYQPPSGSEVQVFALWQDENGKRQNIDARKWIREVGTDDKSLESNFVFAGSMMYKDPETGVESYQAESGDLICVSNFSTATLDVPFKSLEANSGLMFATFTERIPKRGTPVRLVLQVIEPKKPSDALGNAAGEADKAIDYTADLNQLSEPPKQ